MNSYFSVKSANDDLVQKAQMQDKIYHLQNKLQSFAREIPCEYQQRLPYELLSSLANCLLDETINQIMIQLKEIQSITEKSLFEDRMRKIGKFRELRVDQINKIKKQLQNGEITEEVYWKKEREIDKHIEQETDKIDIEIIKQLDQTVSEQQITLERSGVPGFRVTQDPKEIRLQMYIIEFIVRLINENEDLNLKN